MSQRDSASRATEPVSTGEGAIALVGAGVRLPGGVGDLDAYWALLRDGVDAVRPVPADRWDRDAWYDPDPAAPGKMNVREGGFLEDISTFDAAFFGISPREAQELDPAQRLLLEVSWEALERASIAPDSLERAPVGVYIGLGLSDYGRRHFLGPDPRRLTPYSGTGSFLSVAAGRISYTLGLQGPAMTVDTACSSSLVAVHLAVQALRRKEIDLALAGGANLLISPEPSVYFSKLGATSPDGRCKTFDARADGYGRGEGVGVVALKRLSDALADGDQVLAVLRGTAVNQDGRSNGLTAPNGAAQQAVVRAALADAGLPAEAIGYIEAHGTGTPLGDPIEIDALKAIFRAREAERPLWVGSVKTNLGHTETAAGIIGLLKMALALKQGAIPPHLHLRELNPRIDLTGSPLRINTSGATVPWEDGPRVGGVSSFGLSGTNAHVVLQAMPEPQPEPVAARPIELVTLSARSEPALRALAGHYAETLQGPEVSWPEVERTALMGRARLPVRLALAGPPSALAERLAAFSRGEEIAGASVATVKGKVAPQVGFLFTGQGAQHPGMALRLAECEPGFRQALQRCADALDGRLERPLQEVLQSPDLDETAWAQPALFAVEVALASWLQALGLQPDVLIGHSVGEIAAAHIAGVLSLEDAASLVVERGRLMASLPRDGAMLAVSASEEALAPALAAYEGEIEVAGLNGPEETVLSGGSAALEVLAAELSRSGARVRRLSVSHAFHSRRMEPILDALEAHARTLTFRSPQIEVLSNLDGQSAGERLCDPRYWRQQARQAVRFADGLSTALSEGCRLFVELGPRPVLSALGMRLAEGRALFLPTLSPEREDQEQLTETLGALWARGVPIDLESRYDSGRKVSLPTMPWMGERYWLDPAPVQDDPLAGRRLSRTWRSAPVGRGRASGRWQVLGDLALGQALAARGATLVDEGAHHVVFAPAEADPGEIASRGLLLAQQAVRQGARLYLVTRAKEPGTASLLGLGRALSAEHPEAWGGLVEREDEVEALADALLAQDGEDIARIRGGSREILRLIPSSSAPAAPPLQIPASGAVLVTGGLGGLGQRLVRRLVERGARHLLLLSRKGAADNQRQAFLAELQAYGAQVSVGEIDLTDREAIASALRSVPSLVGIVHAAGVSEDARLLEQDPERLARAMAAKVESARTLDELTLDRPLSFFVAVSSASALLGVAGQAAYAAANAALEALIQARRARGLPGAVLVYGPVAGPGMAERVSASVQASWDREGVRLLDEATALAAFERACQPDAPAELFLAPFDWTRWKAARREGARLVEALVGPQAPPLEAPPVSALVEALTRAPQGARRAMLVDHVQQVVSRLLGHGPAHRIAVSEGFFDSGMDSMMAMELRQRLQVDLGVELPATLAFDHPTVLAVVDHLLERLSMQQGARQAEHKGPDPASSREPIAIVGVSCRLPGGVTDLDSLWALLLAGGDAITEIPADRFDADRYDALRSRYGGFIEGIEHFEPALFRISPREARSLDPQQRLLLECSWHALEDAAIAPDRLEGSATGVFVGIGASEYGLRFDPSLPDADAYAGTGNETSFAAGRVAYVLGLRGPALSVNTACSSSLVSVHLAVQALRAGQCQLALAGGVNAIVGPDISLWMSHLQALSPDGRCKAFDAAADGYVRSEGCAMVVLKRLSDALRDGDNIYAVIRGSATGHDGASAGLTVPNGLAQRQVIEAALQDAGVDARSIGYVECHGTGTRLGDPIEVRALGQALAQGRGEDEPLYLGTIKSNLGHLEAGAGIAGLLRAMLAVHRGLVPPLVHLRTPNPELPLAEFPALQLPRQGVPWSAAVRRAGVSSFGISGTNAHLVLEQAPSRALVEPSGRPLSLVTLSGRTRDQVKAEASALLAWLEQREVRLQDVAYTRNTGRAALAHRAVVVANDLTALRGGLQRVARGAGISEILGEPPKVVFLCTGAGPQAAGMARALYEAEPTFREALQRAAQAAEPVLDLPLLELIYPPDGREDERLHELAYTQPAMFALEWALAETWRSYGLRPDAVIGHSTGQFVAATLAGVFDLASGMRLMAERARLMSSQPRTGAMVACFASEQVIAGYLKGHEAQVALAAVNGPAEVVISGRAEEVSALARQIEADGIEIRSLNISHAAHSPLMDPILDRFEALVGATPMARPVLPLVENVWGQIAGEEVTTARYWREHLRQPVQFARGMRALVQGGYRIFVEIGNHPVLAGAGARCVEDVPDAVFLPSLRRDRGDFEQLLETAGRLWTLGVPLDWQGFHRHAPGAKIPLPGLQFQRQRHWVERPQRAARAASQAPGSDQRYVLRWEPWRPNVEAMGSRGDRPLVVLADTEGLAGALARSQHRRVVRVYPGPRGCAFQKDGDEITLDPFEPSHLQRVLDEHRPQHVLHLWSLGRSLGPNDSPSEVATVPVLGLLGLLRASPQAGAPTLWVVTRGACSVAGEAPELAVAPLLGLATVAALELSEQGLVRLDLDPATPLGEATSQVELVLNSGLREEQLALRGGKFLQRRLARLETAPAAIAIRPDRSYLVTGGQGALGQRVVDWLLERGAGAVVVVGRSVNPDRPQRARVLALRADVGERAEVMALADALRARGLPPLAGIFHAAGLLDDARLSELWLERLLPVWKPKLDGTWNLLQAWPDLELFVGFSSAASMLGNPGQGNYASANAFLDAAAAWLTARGQRAVSLCWGPWAGGGLASEATSRDWERTGVRPLVPSEALATMAGSLGGPPQLAVVDLDWARWSRILPRVPALVRAFVPDEEAPQRTLLDELRALPAETRRERLASALCEAVGEILGLPVEAVDRKRRFFEAGMDSLMAVELANRVRTLLKGALPGKALPATLAFDHPSVDLLTDWLLGRLSLGEAAIPALAALPGSRGALDEPIAIVGASCRMPGGANDPEAFWRLLIEGRDPMRPVPAARWDLDAFYDPTPGTPGKMYVREAGWVDQELVEGFDPEFFGISPREAESLDPQQRMLLEVAYEALERAGLTTERLYRSRTGVFVGAGSSGYHQRFQQPGGPLYVDSYAGTGALEAFVSGRVAYALGLHGPNLALNTACSSTLVATHLAVQALRTGEAELALAGGVHLMLSPENFVYVSQIRALSPDGRCKTFDASADGYGRAEGCGVFVLKRLSDALRDRDPVLAVIRGTAIGHDGPSSGLTVPYGPAQVQVLSEALARSGLHPHEVSYLEAHGTGTALGDPIEVHAIEEVYAQGRGRDNPLHIGAVKSNLGHLEVAAGAASLLKMVLALQHRQIPPHLHFVRPNPDLDLESGVLVVDTAPTPWTSPKGPLRCGVSGFGLAGTNVHLVMEEAPPRPPIERPAGPERPMHLLVLSARSDGALRELASRYASRLAEGASLPDMAYSAATTRIPYEHRLALPAPDAASARASLQAFARGELSGRAVHGLAPARAPKVAWLFSGQGSQQPGMARELYQHWSAFREGIDRCVAVLGPPLAEVLLGEDERVHDTTWTQPALFAFEVALASLWRSWGVQPALLAGHSIGQIAAACVAEVFSLEDGLRLVAERGRLMGALPRDGAMLAVFADEPTTREVLQRFQQQSGRDEVSLAAVNHPEECTISGRSEAVQAVAAALAERGIDTRPLHVSHAFHSPLMEPMLDAFEAAAGRIRYQPAKIPVACNLTGGMATDAQLSSPRYWREHARGAVRFADNLKALAEQGAELFIEVGPHTSLLAMGRRTLPQARLGWLPSMQRGEPAHERLVPSLGACFVRGVRLDWEGFDRDYVRERVLLPTYPWQRRRIWLGLEEFPAHKARWTRWLLERRFEPLPPPSGEAVGDWAVLGTSPEADELRRALVRLGGRIVEDPAAAAAGLVVMPSLPEGIGADPTMPALMLLDAVQQLEPGAKVPVTVVIRQSDRPLAGTLLGLARVVRAERPELRVVTLETGEAPLEQWLPALLARDREPEVRIEGGQREVARLVQATFEQGPAPALDEGTVLVTGGTSGVGLACARWLVEHGARSLVLMGRSEPAAEAAAQIEALRAQGALVVVARGDVSQAADVERIVGEVAQRGQVLIGVVHSAGVLADATLARLDVAAFRAVYAPKVQGSWNLHLATQGLPLRFFVMFAAGAGLMGAPGQGNYAAANAFQDALAHWRQAQGLPALAIDWGSWAEVGMAARAGALLERQRQEGIGSIPLREGLDLFGRLLSHGRPQVAVLPVDWARHVASAHGGRVPPMLERLVTVAPPPPPQAPSETQRGSTLLEVLAATPRSEWHARILARLQTAARQILRVPAERELPVEVPLLELGLDSLLAIELRNAMLDEGLDLPVARVMTGPSLTQLAQIAVTQAEEQVLADRPGDGLQRPFQGESEPPINVFVSHFAAFAFGVLFVLVGYISAAWWSAQAPEEPEPPPVAPMPPSRVR